MKKILLSLVALVSAGVFAQEEKGRVDFSVGVETQHLWRGLKVSQKPVFTALTSFDLTQDGALKVGTWGGMSTGDDGYKEIDYFIQYSKGGFTVGLWDLYNFGNDKFNPAGKDIFNYASKNNGHLLDLRFNYFFGEENPLSLEADFIFYGTADARFEGNDVKQKYSTYLQASYAVNAGAGVSVTPFIGAGFALNGKDGNNDLYGAKENFSVVNLGFNVAKTVNIGNYSLPLVATTMWNPAQKFGQVALTATLF